MLFARIYFLSSTKTDGNVICAAKMHIAELTPP